jgi:hypothetical protein
MVQTDIILLKNKLQYYGRWDENGMINGAFGAASQTAVTIEIS